MIDEKEILNALTLQAILSKNGIDIKDNQVQCINHSAHKNNDKNKSATFYPNHATGHARIFCHVCRTGWDALDCIEHFHNLTDYKEQVQKIKNDYLYLIEEREQIKRQQPDYENSEPVSLSLEQANKIYTTEAINHIRSFSNNEIIKNGQWVNQWPYYDINKNVIGIDCRFELLNETQKTDKIVCTFWYNGKSLKIKNAPDFIYNLYSSINGNGKDKPIIIHEGAKCAKIANDNLKSFCHVSWNKGAGNASKIDWSIYKNRKVYILPDNDTPGIIAANEIRRQLPSSIILSEIHTHYETNNIDGADIEDILTIKKDVKDIESFIFNYSKYFPGSTVIDMYDLLSMKHEPQIFIIENLIPENSLSLLAAPGKAGKSFMSLSMALNVSKGTAFLNSLKTQKSKVLYLSLEDSPYRLKNRLQKMNAEIEHGQIFITTRWTQGLKAIDDLQDFIKKNEIGFCVIDTWQRFALIEDGNNYNEVTNMAGLLQQVAQDCNCSIVIIHHVKKGKEEDFTFNTLGSVGLPAAMDSILILNRPRNEIKGTLSITGRDIEEQNFNLNLNTNTMTWSLEAPEENKFSNTDNLSTADKVENLFSMRK
jgi:5S rRNA maturation endonuclease (ribonuclease M5)